VRGSAGGTGNVAGARYGSCNSMCILIIGSVTGAVPAP